MGCGCGKSFSNRSGVQVTNRRPSSQHAPSMASPSASQRSANASVQHAPNRQVVQSASLQRHAAAIRRQV